MSKKTIPIIFMTLMVSFLLVSCQLAIQSDKELSFSKLVPIKEINSQMRFVDLKKKLEISGSKKKTLVLETSQPDSAR
jgi:hypothetical protein